MSLLQQGEVNSTGVLGEFHLQTGKGMARAGYTEHS